MDLSHKNCRCGHSLSSHNDGRKCLLCECECYRRAVFVVGDQGTLAASNEYIDRILSLESENSLLKDEIHRGSGKIRQLEAQNIALQQRCKRLATIVNAYRPVIEKGREDLPDGVRDIVLLEQIDEEELREALLVEKAQIRRIDL